MTRIGFVTTAFAFAMLTMWIANASAEDCDCPQCGVKICVAEAEKTKVKKTTFSVEEKDVCIPRFNWPWQKSCPPKCGHVRTVCVLKKGSRECESCGYKWEFTTVPAAPSPSCILKSGSHRLHKVLGQRAKRRDAACETGSDNGCATGWETYSTDSENTQSLAVPEEYKDETEKGAVESVLKN